MWMRAGYVHLVWRGKCLLCLGVSRYIRLNDEWQAGMCDLLVVHSINQQYVELALSRYNFGKILCACYASTWYEMKEILCIQLAVEICAI